MPLTITSPKHSLVNFNDKITDFIIPAYKSIAVAFQFMVPAASEIALPDTLSVKIADRSNGIIYTHSSLVATTIGVWGKLKNISDFDFPINVTSGLLSGLYTTKKTLFAKIKEVYALSITDYNFSQYCLIGNLPVVSFPYQNLLLQNKTASISYYKGLQQVTITENPNTLFSTATAITDCFKYVISHTSGNVYSNLFKKETNNNYITQVTYSNNEDYAGFNYPFTSVFNQVWLPFYLRAPKFPVSKKMYRRSNGSYKVQSASIEKEWEMITEYMPADIHEKIVVMLEHDNVSFFNRQINGTATIRDEYDIDWQDRQDYAQAKAKILEPFEARNSNCEKRINC